MERRRSNRVFRFGTLLFGCLGLGAKPLYGALMPQLVLSPRSCSVCKSPHYLALGCVPPSAHIPRNLPRPRARFRYFAR
eukprot:1768759-Pleurochrysis_carterae.AAC.1